MRKPNIAYNAQKLDEAIREIDGGRYNKSNISTFICGCANTYYNGCMSDGKISEEALKKICKFYGLKFKDYIEIPNPEPVEPPKPKVVEDKQASSATNPTIVNVDTTAIVDGLSEITKNGANISSSIMAQLLAINKAIAELIAQQKSTNYLLGQIIDKNGAINKHVENVDTLMTNRENKFNNKSNVKRIG